MDTVDYDANASFYFSNILNSLKLFSMNVEALKELASPAFNPIFELETEFDYAFLPAPFNTVFRNRLMDIAIKERLLEFKIQVNHIASGKWDYQFIDNHPQWIKVRLEAIRLLNDIGAKHNGCKVD